MIDLQHCATGITRLHYYHSMYFRPSTVGHSTNYRLFIHVILFRVHFFKIVKLDVTKLLIDGYISQDHNKAFILVRREPLLRANTNLELNNDGNFL